MEGQLRTFWVKVGLIQQAQFCNPYLDSCPTVRFRSRVIVCCCFSFFLFPFFFLKSSFHSALKMPELVILSVTQPEHLCCRLPRAPSDQPNQQRTELLTLLFEESSLSSSFAWPPWDSLCSALSRAGDLSGSGWVSHGRCHKEQFVTLPKDQTSFLALWHHKKQDSKCHLIKGSISEQGSSHCVWSGLSLPNFTPLKAKISVQSAEKGWAPPEHGYSCSKYMPKMGWGRNCLPVVLASSPNPPEKLWRVSY